jgi:hypothetical protein
MDKKHTQQKSKRIGRLFNFIGYRQHKWRPEPTLINGAYSQKPFNESRK